jgi:tRNA-Thr(GGU) m(6)t(6)A37 methyltransferase TsaA
VKAMKNIELKPIGIVHSPLKNISGNPVQSSFSEVEGQIEIFEEY